MKPFLSLSLVACVGCVSTSGTTSDTSSDDAAAAASAANNAANGSGGSGAANGSGAAASTGAAGSNGGSGGIPLDGLCAAMAPGYQRLFNAVELGYSGDCHPALNSEADVIVFVNGSQFTGPELAGSICATDGGFLTGVIEDIAQREAAGRIAYDGVAAERCRAGGRSFIRFDAGVYEGTFSALGMSTDAGLSAELVEACSHVVVGLQTSGEACLTTGECAQDGPGADCVGIAGASCEGTCQPRGAAGDSCGTRHPSCRAGLSCVTPGYGKAGKCVAPLGAGATCAPDGGAQLPCNDGFVCSGGVCQALPGAGALCINSKCANGLWCKDGRCASPSLAGSACDVYDSKSCAECLRCMPPNVPSSVPDAGPPLCRTYQVAGESCTDSPCHFGLFCNAGTCVAPVDHGATCVHADLNQVSSDSFSINSPPRRGNCRDAQEVCTGTPATCGARAAVNQPCEADADDKGTQGTCKQDLFCSRASPTSTTGTCRPIPLEGAPCRSGPATSDECASIRTGDYSSTTMNCSSLGNDAGKVCMASGPKGQGGLCVDHYACENTLYCARDGGVGSCQPAASLNAECGNIFGQRCAEGTCQSTGRDGGYLYRCAPFIALRAECPSTFSTACGDNRCVATDAGFFCATRAADGEECSNTSDCVRGDTCSLGVCKPAACNNSETTSGCLTPQIGVFLIFGAVLFPFGRRRRRR